MCDEVRSKNLQRYYDNKEKYNEKSKTYFRSVWYVKNRDMILKKQKIYRDSKPKQYKKKVVIHTVVDPSLCVSFD